MGVDDGIKIEPEQRRARDALLYFYMDQLPMLILGQLCAGLIMVYFVWDEGISTALLWLASDVILVALTWLLIKYCKRYFNRLDFAYWIYMHLILVSLMGMLWGLTTVLFMDTSDPYGVVIHTILLLGILSGALYSMSIFPAMFYCFLLPVLIPYVFTLYTAHVFFEIAVATLVLSMTWSWVSFRIYTMIKELFVARERNEVLVESLREEKVLVERASHAKTRFLAAASHDLRQPLQAQRLFAEAIRDRTKDSELREMSEHMVESQRAMQSMLDSLLDMSQLDAGVVVPKSVPVCLYDVVSKFMYDFNMLAADKGLGFYVHWPPRDAMVMCDQGLLEIIIRNLLGNAICYTEQGSVMLAVRKRSGHWRIEVRDSGIGIAPDQQVSVFEEFRQLDNPERNRGKGLGLGLSIVQRLCDLLDYPLSLHSRLGKGSVFAFELPLSLGQVGGPRDLGDLTGLVDVVQPELDMEALLALRILVVDDDPIVRDALLRSLSSLGFVVHAAAHCDAALAVVRSYIPDVMIVDYRLSEQHTGAQVIETLRGAIGADVPAILLTGDTAPKELKELCEIDYPVLHKPVSMQLLLTTMQNISTCSGSFTGS